MNPSEKKEQIPNELIFIWIGNTLPWSCKLAILSAAHHCKPKKIWLIHRHLESMYIKDVQDSLKGAEVEILKLEVGLFKDLPLSKKISEELYESLEAPASIANMARLAFLWKNGGVYLDGDTITIKDLKPLRKYPGFCGLEPLALPSDLFQSKNPLRWGLAGIKLGLREICARVPNGYSYFKIIEPGYHQCVNNAVVGSVANNPIIERACNLIEKMNPDERLKRFRLGTHLLQRVTNNRSGKYMQVLSSDYFYPLGPEISSHWFRNISKNKDSKLITDNTKVIHWYHSVEKRFLKGVLSPDYINENKNSPFSRLVEEYL